MSKYRLHCADCLGLTDPFSTEVLLASGYWPGNLGTLSYLFDEAVFIMWDKFRKYMPGSSERAFLKSLNSISEDNGRVSLL